MKFQPKLYVELTLSPAQCKTCLYFTLILTKEAFKIIIIFVLAILTWSKFLSKIFGLKGVFLINYFGRKTEEVNPSCCDWDLVLSYSYSKKVT